MNFPTFYSQHSCAGMPVKQCVESFFCLQRRTGEILGPPEAAADEGGFSRGDHAVPDHAGPAPPPGGVVPAAAGRDGGGAAGAASGGEGVPAPVPPPQVELLVAGHEGEESVHERHLSER